MIRRAGFTLVELLLASAIAVMLMGAVMVSIGTIASDRKRLAETESVAQVSSHYVVGFLRRDLIVAQRMWKPTAKHGLILTGYGGLNPKTLEPDGRLVRVEYVVKDSTLVRRQWYLDGKPEFWAEIVSRDVARVEVERVLQRVRDTGKRKKQDAATTNPAQPPEPQKKKRLRKRDPIPDAEGDADMDGDGYIDEEWEKQEEEQEEQKALASTSGRPSLWDKKEKKERPKDLPLRMTPRVRLTVDFSDGKRRSYAKEILVR